jgi:hypothetical protein
MTVCFRGLFYYVHQNLVEVWNNDFLVANDLPISLIVDELAGEKHDPF